jgi:hypothetical protein
VDNGDMRAAIMCALIAAAGPAAAQPGDSGAQEPPSYATELLAVDAATLGAAAAVALTDMRLDFEGPPNRLQTFAASWWMLAAVATPAVHFAHRRRMGWASLGVRLGAPLLIGGAGALAYCMTTIENPNGSSQFGDGCEDRGLPAGLIAGTALAAGFDAYLLSRAHPGDTWEDELWYGWQTLAVDAAGVGLGLYAISRDAVDSDTGEPNSDTLNLALSMYLVGMIGAPWVHVARGEPLRALGDFGLRAFVPPLFALGGMIGWCTGTAGSGSGSCIDSGAEVGLLGGAVLAAVIDSLVLSTEPAPRRPSTGPPGLAWTPGFALEPGGARLTLGAAF